MAERGASHGSHGRIDWGFPIGGLVLLALFALLFVVARPVYYGLMGAAFRNPTPLPFFDLEYVFNTLRCWHRGVDVYATNPCDRLDRVMDYSPWLLRVAILDLPPGYAQGGGLLLAAGFFTSLGWLAGAAPGSRRVLAMAAVSSLSVFALERGNIDIVMFLGALLAVRLTVAGDRWLPLAALVIFLLAIVKFYPIVLTALFLRRASWRARACLVAVPVATVLALALVWPELARALAGTPASTVFGDMWGRKQLFLEIGPVLETVSPTAARVPLVRAACVVLALLPALYTAVRVLGDRALGGALTQLPAFAAAALYAGAVVITGCFAVTDNIGYRAIFFLFALPGLMLLSRQDVRRPLRWLPVLILVLMFKLTIFQALRTFHLAPEDGAFGSLVWLGLGSCWWCVVAALASLVLRMTLDAEGLRRLLSLLRITRNTAS